MIKILIVATLFFITSCAKNWSYYGENDPKNWGNLKEEYRLCKIGYNQSPIDVDGEFRKGELQFFYSESEVEKKPINHVTRIEFFTKEFLLRGKKKYFLRYLEFHHPSEHFIKGEQYSLEMQIYHKSDDEQWLVVTKFLEIGKKNSEFDDLIKFLSDKKNEGKINLNKIINKDEKLFFYDGSLTIPPCNEGVKWYISQDILTISKEQMSQIIKSAILTKSNARPVQEFHPDRVF